jgi:hypothetical protein
MVGFQVSLTNMPDGSKRRHLLAKPKAILDDVTPGLYDLEKEPALRLVESDSVATKELSPNVKRAKDFLESVEPKKG